MVLHFVFRIKGTAFALLLLPCESRRLLITSLLNRDTWLWFACTSQWTNMDVIIMEVSAHLHNKANTKSLQASVPLRRVRKH